MKFAASSSTRSAMRRTPSNRESNSTWKPKKSPDRSSLLTRELSTSSSIAEWSPKSAHSQGSSSTSWTARLKKRRPRRRPPSRTTSRGCRMTSWRRTRRTLSSSGRCHTSTASSPGVSADCASQRPMTHSARHPSPNSTQKLRYLTRTEH